MAARSIVLVLIGVGPIYGSASPHGCHPAQTAPRDAAMELRSPAGGRAASRRYTPVDGARKRRPGSGWGALLVSRTFWVTALVILLIAVGITATTASVAGLSPVLVPPWGGTVVEFFLALGYFFVALVYFLFSEPDKRSRLRWLALGGVVVGLGDLLFGGLDPLIPGHEDRVNTAMYLSILSRSFALGCAAIGLVLSPPPALTRSLFTALLTLYAVLSLLLRFTADQLPALSSWSTHEAMKDAMTGPAAVPAGLTPWHWLLRTIPLALALITAIGTARHLRRAPLGDWLLLAMVVWTGSEAYALFRPTAYSSILTLTTVLRFASIGVLALGAVLYLYRISNERTEMLARERELNTRLTSLAGLKADFSAMIAHELSAPLAAIRHAADVCAIDALSPTQRRTLTLIKNETDLLAALTSDVQTASAIEREDFAARIEEVAADSLVAQAKLFATSLPGDHPLVADHTAHTRVRADVIRIEQVLDNLLSNAGKFSAPGSPITLRTHLHDGRVWFAVSDTGMGIPPDDLPRIFEKFGRGRDAVGNHVPGMGLGLYLSRRIMRAHGSDLRIESTVGEGTTVSFALEAAS